MAAAAATTTKFELYILTRKRDKQVQKPKIVELRTQQQDIHHHALFFRPLSFLSNKEQANLQS